MVALYPRFAHPFSKMDDYTNGTAMRCAVPDISSRLGQPSSDGNFHSQTLVYLFSKLPLESLKILHYNIWGFFVGFFLFIQKIWE